MRLLLLNNHSFQISKSASTTDQIELPCNPTISGDDSESARKLLTGLKNGIEKYGKHLPNKWNIFVIIQWPSLSFPEMTISLEEGNLLDTLHLADKHLKIIFKGSMGTNPRNMFRGHQLPAAVTFTSEELSATKNPSGENRLMVKHSVTMENPTDWQSSSNIHVAGQITVEVIGDLDWSILGPPLDNTAVLIKMLEESVLPDFHIIAGNHQEIPCHKAVLAIHSAELAAMLNSGMKESSEAKLELKREGGKKGILISEDGVHAFLEFLYYRQYKVALELLEVGHQYGISEMESTMKSIFLERSAEWCDVDVALEIFLHSHSRKLVEVLKLKLDELASSELYLQLYPQETARSLFELTLSMTTSP